MPYGKEFYVKDSDSYTIDAMTPPGREVSTQQVFAVIRTRGPAWQDSRPLEGQADWAGHASFMNSLARDGFVILGGPLEGTPDMLLVVRAKDPGKIRSRLAEDPGRA